MAATCWWYFIAKFTEFFDTIFFNLRKKTEHVSTLHVIHHGCMPFSVWLGLKFAPGKEYTKMAFCVIVCGGHISASKNQRIIAPSSQKPFKPI